LLWCVWLNVIRINQIFENCVIYKNISCWRQSML
jgi:hypothetical protein